MFFPEEKNLSIAVTYLSHTYFAERKRTISRANKCIVIIMQWCVKQEPRIIRSRKFMSPSSDLLFVDSDDHTGKLLWLPMITKRNYVRSISVASDKKRVAVVVVIVLQRESEASAFSISLIGSFVQSNSTPPPLRLQYGDRYRKTRLYALAIWLRIPAKFSPQYTLLLRDNRIRASTPLLSIIFVRLNVVTFYLINRRT